ncbi:hypothetical protein [Winogradskyella tangerina]|uniref:hypothetical protein n=1 Tax=Winogradskyella tangerina TaxID=2023240 RepID=UPI000DBE6BA4|nr:hypothetical protein [Winogradskyella tangerina]
MRFKLLILLFCLGQIAISQTKNEKEERVSLTDFPEAAQTLIETLPKDCKRLRFYKETDGEKQSFEAKFKYKRRRYSLEFSKNGVIEDLEVQSKIRAIDDPIRNNITNYFDATFTKSKLIKIQKQYIYYAEIEPELFLAQILSGTTSIAPNFEIVAEVKIEKQRELRELTFDSSGVFLNYRTINPTSYEHVLY